MNFSGVTNIDELIKKESPQKMIEEMVSFFKDRTKKHIELVQKYCQKIYDYDKKRFSDILDRGKEHDQSKYREPEMAPYVLITWEYHCKDLGKDCKLSKKSRDEMNEATEHHIKNNAHHPEFHSNSTNESTINRENRDAIPDKMVDATKMSDLDIAEMCLTGDTKISLLNGTEVTIAELSNRKEFWLYSCTPDGKIVPGKGHSARKTRKVSRIVRITLDNNEFMECTENHKIMMRDGTYVEASQLKINDSLMPLYKKDKDEYEQVYNLANNRWEFTHRIVIDGCLGGYSYYIKKLGTDKIVCHHKNFMNEHNKKNNDPSNLEVMTRDSHYKAHSEKQRKVGSAVLKKLWATPEFREKKRKLSGEIGKITGPANLTQYNKSKEHRLMMSKRMASLNRKSKQCSYCNKIFGNVGALTNHIKICHEGTPELRNTISEKNSKVWKNAAYKEKMRLVSIQNATTPAKCGTCNKICGNAGALGSHIKIHNKETIVINHKIINIEIRNTQRDVYDLTVDKYHNFALTSGIFVHNCADWAAMGEEKGNTPKEWADKNVNKRWKFTEEQERLIYDLIQAIWA